MLTQRQIGRIKRYLELRPSAGFRGIAKDLDLPSIEVRRYLYTPQKSESAKSPGEYAAELIAAGPPADWGLPAWKWPKVVKANFGEPVEV